MRDAWGGDLRFVKWVPRTNCFLVRSAGPDKRFDTADDLAAYVDVQDKQIVGNSKLDSFYVNVEHDRGPFNGFAEIVGSVKDRAGSVIPGGPFKRHVFTEHVRLNNVAEAREAP